MIEIYWIEMLDGINFLLILTGVIILIVAAIMIAMSFCEMTNKKYEDVLPLRKNGIKLLFLSLILFIIWALTPNTEQAYRIDDASTTINHYIDSDSNIKIEDEVVGQENKDRIDSLIDYAVSNFDPNK